MTEEPGKRWRHTIHHSAYHNNIYNFNDLYKSQLSMLLFMLPQYDNSIELTGYNV